VTVFIDIVGSWGARSENPDTIAKRLARWFAALTEIDPLFEHWKRGGMRNRSVVPQMIESLPPNVAELRDWVAENPSFGSRDGYKQELGFRVHARTPQETGLFADFWLWTSHTQSPGWFDNRISVTFYPIERSETSYLITLTRAALLASAATWDCEWVAVAPGNYSNVRLAPGKLPEKFASGWMVYLDKTHADKMLEPEDITVERLDAGAVRRTAIKKEIFDRSNLIHRAAARRIQAALAPLNAEAEGA